VTCCSSWRTHCSLTNQPTPCSRYFIKAKSFPSIRVILRIVTHPKINQNILMSSPPFLHWATSWLCVPIFCRIIFILSLFQTNASFILSTCQISYPISIVYIVPNDQPQSDSLWTVQKRSKLLRCWIVRTSLKDQTRNTPCRMSATAYSVF